jgi:hypothetical protein
MPRRRDTRRPAPHDSRLEAQLMFLFFSNGLGCFGSLLVSIVITVILFAVCSR